MTEIDVSNCTFYVEGECDIYQDSCDKLECQYKWYKRIEAENTKLKEKLEKIKETIKDIRCIQPSNCWMNQDVGTDDIYGCEGDDYKGCPNGIASYIYNIIEGAEDDD